MATYKDMAFQPALVATTSSVFLAIGLLGITYSVLSSSWDDDREGSVLGIEEFGRNVDNLKDGLSRTKGKAVPWCRVESCVEVADMTLVRRIELLPLAACLRLQHAWQKTRS